MKEECKTRLTIMYVFIFLCLVTPQARSGEEGTNYGPMFGGIIAGVLIFAFVIIVVAMFIRYNYR